MTQYRARPIEVEAIRYNGELVRDLPEWLKDYQSHTPYGFQGIGRNVVGELLVPIGGQVVTIKHGDYLFRMMPDDLDDGAASTETAKPVVVVATAKGVDFESRFEAIEPELSADS